MDLNPTTIDRMIGEVTQEDIDHGIKLDHEACALALTIERMFPGYKIFVDDYVNISDNSAETYIDITMTDDLIKWMDAFDTETEFNGAPVKPIEIIINTDPSNNKKNLTIDILQKDKK